ncbi:helix-turn-helix domain-containing protein [Aequorivita todarodis]|uniref:helix-turn-helix domain-containing protein n=1 Tax=Aequorivita todarodis TaxID=2036821 RepID=UPI0023506306|nr:helix-turn-helix domain-containing protein [Aequorivita todarodis]MDC8000516.1 helix-turn-helix domain-containing protein [Aequorivita todarodis]
MVPLFRFSGAERLAYSQANFMEKMMPLNYLRTTHVSIYGFVMVYFIVKERIYKMKKQGIYLTIIVAIYFVSAILQSYLTSFADSYRQFVIYFFIASTIILISGFILYAYPNILQQIHQKYFSSNLNEKERKRIAQKIGQLESGEKFFLNSAIDLKSFCEMIGERPHYVSQVFSEEFNTSFSNFINEKRVEYAKQMLQNPEFDNLKILAIAFDSGFNNNVTFNKAFVKFCGMTPGKFRKHSRKNS